MARRAWARKLSMWVDGLAEIRDPRRATERRLARIQADYLRTVDRDMRNLAGGYDGANTSRVMEWSPGGSSADQELLTGAREDMVDRILDLDRNNGYVRAAVKTNTTNVVGTGITGACAIDHEALGITPEEAQEYKAVTDRLWKQWTEHYDKWADYEGRLNWWQIQTLAERQYWTCGETFVVRQQVPTRNPRRPRLALHVIEPHRISTPTSPPDGADIREGVELGSRGQPVAIHVAKSHPGEYSFGKGLGAEHVRVPIHDRWGVRQVLHIYDTLRPGQTRAEPTMAPLIETWRHVGGYETAELIAARVSAMTCGIVKTTNPGAAAIGASSMLNSEQQRLENFSTGKFHYLQPNEDFLSFDPKRPNSQFDPFVQHQLRKAAATLGMSYELYTKDFRGSTYTSARAGILQTIKGWMVRQRVSICELCRPVWMWHQRERFLRGELPAFCQDYFQREELWAASEWTPDGWDVLDPLKETQAVKARVSMFLSSIRRECARRGESFDEILQEQVDEQQKIKDSGLSSQAPTGDTDYEFPSDDDATPEG